MKLICKCGRSYKTFPSRLKKGLGKYCSRACYETYRWPGERTIEIICPCGRSRTTFRSNIKENHGKYCSQKCAKANYVRPLGIRYEYKEPHPSWFKEKTHVTYSGLHGWIRRIKDYPKVCENCGLEKKLDWANISGKYVKDETDWLALCRKCHWHFDHRGVLI